MVNEQPPRQPKREPPPTTFGYKPTRNWPPSSLAIEAWYPLGNATLVTLGYLLLFWLAPPLRERLLPGPGFGRLLPLIANVGTIAVGTLAIALAVLLSIDDRPIIAALRLTGKHRPLIGYFRVSIRASLLTTVTSVCLLNVNYNIAWGERAAYLVAGFVFLLSWSLSAFHRVFHLLCAVLDKDADKPEPQRPS